MGEKKVYLHFSFFVAISISVVLYVVFLLEYVLESKMSGGSFRPVSYVWEMSLQLMKLPL